MTRFPKLYKFYAKYPLVHMFVLLIGFVVIVPVYMIFIFPPLIWEDGLKYSFEELIKYYKETWGLFIKVNEKYWLGEEKTIKVNQKESGDK